MNSVRGANFMERNDNIFNREGRNDLHWTAMTYHNGKFYMLYNYGTATTGPTPFMIGLATSDNGENFKTEQEIVLNPEFGKWDSHLIEAHSIIRAEGKWRLYYYCFSKFS